MNDKDAVQRLQDAVLTHVSILLCPEEVERLLALVVRGRTAEAMLATHLEFLGVA